MREVTRLCSVLWTELERSYAWLDLYHPFITRMSLVSMDDDRKAYILFCYRHVNTASESCTTTLPRYALHQALHSNACIKKTKPYKEHITRFSLRFSDPLSSSTMLAMPWSETLRENSLLNCTPIKVLPSARLRVYANVSVSSAFFFPI